MCALSLTLGVPPNIQKQREEVLKTLQSLLRVYEGVTHGAAIVMIVRKVGASGHQKATREGVVPGGGGLLLFRKGRQPLEPWQYRGGREMRNERECISCARTVQPVDVGCHSCTGPWRGAPLVSRRAAFRSFWTPTKRNRIHETPNPDQLCRSALSGGI